MSQRTPPFPRGMTWGATTTTDGTYVEGSEWEFPDANPNTGVTRSRNRVRCRAVRNVAAAALLPKRLARLKAGTHAQVDGYTAQEFARGLPIDEYLPSAGCAVNDICWVVVDGPAVCRTDLATLTAITTGDGQANQPSYLLAITAATSGATTAGRVAVAGAGTTGQTLADRVQNRIGYALSSLTANQTDSDVLVMVRQY